MNYVKGFDTLRALAIFTVIIQHWGPFFPPHTTAFLLRRLLVPDGVFGVDLFFVLSSFLITSNLLRAKKSVQAGNRLFTVRNFFASRALRIFPIYYLLLLLMLVCNNPGINIRQHAVYYFTYTSNILQFQSRTWIPFTPSWSLAVEEQIYLLWPWLLLFINDKYLKSLFIAIIFIGLLSNFIMLRICHLTFFSLVINCFESFGLGALYALVYTDELQRQRFRRWFHPVFIIALVPTLQIRLSPWGIWQLIPFSAD